MDGRGTRIRSIGGATAARAGGSGAAAARMLGRLDAELEILDRAESLLREATELSTEDSRMAFELAHRASLRAAGVVIARANLERRRPLPLNAWTALDRLGAGRRDWAQSMAPFVAERDRLQRREDATADPELLADHLALTAARILQVREEVLGATLPQDLTALAG